MSKRWNPADPWGERRAQNKADAQAAWRFRVRWMGPCLILGLVGTALADRSSGSVTRRSTPTTAVVPTSPTVSSPVDPTATSSDVRRHDDPSLLAADLQGVLTRFTAFSYMTRTAPANYTQTKIADGLEGVASLSAIVDGIIPYWAAAEAGRTTILPGPSGVLRADLTAVTTTTADSVTASFCFFDDAVVVALPGGATVRDEPRLRRGEVEFGLEDDHWEIERYTVTSDERVPVGSTNPCVAEAIVPRG